MIDSHMHTPLCHHASGAPLEYAYKAIQANLTGICFTEHMPLPNDADANVRLRQSDLLTYRDLIENTQNFCAQALEVRCGLEMDYIPGIEAFSAKLLEQFAWDYVIGSVHRVGELAYGLAPEPENAQSYWHSYYNLIAVAARSGLYNSIGHLDLPRRWTAAPENHLEMVLPALDTIAEYGLALDFNTSGWRSGLESPHPTVEVLHHAHQRQIPLVLGSDAHNPQQVGSHFAQAIALAKEAGYSQVVAFKQRQLEAYAI